MVRFEVIGILGDYRAVTLCSAGGIAGDELVQGADGQFLAESGFVSVTTFFRIKLRLRVVQGDS